MSTQHAIKFFKLNDEDAKEISEFFRYG